MATRIWPVYVTGDCEGRSTKVAGWFESEEQAVAFAVSDECRRMHAAETTKAGTVGQPIQATELEPIGMASNAVEHDDDRAFTVPSFRALGPDDYTTLEEIRLEIARIGGIGCPPETTTVLVWARTLLKRLPSTPASERDSIDEAVDFLQRYCPTKADLVELTRRMTDRKCP